MEGWSQPPSLDAVLVFLYEASKKLKETQQFQDSQQQLQWSYSEAEFL